MPTLEERVAKMEQDFKRFKADATGAYQDMAMQVTLTRALGENSLGRLAMMHDEMNHRFASVHTAMDIHFDATNAHFDLLPKHADRTDRRLDAVESHLSEHTVLLKGHTERLDRVEGVLSGHTTLLNEHTVRFDRVESLLGEILTRLPEKS